MYYVLQRLRACEIATARGDRQGARRYAGEALARLARAEPGGLPFLDAAVAKTRK